MRIIVKKYVDRIEIFAIKYSKIDNLNKDQNSWRAVHTKHIILPTKQYSGGLTIEEIQQIINQNY